MRVRIVLALALAVGVGCAGKSRRFDDEPSAGGGAGEQGGSTGVSGGSGGTQGGSAGTALGGDGGTGVGGNAGTSAGGSAGTTAGGSSSGGAAGASDADCDDERRALRNFINENKSCTDTSDCATSYIGCGITEDGCTGAVYTNLATNPDEFQARRERLEECLRTHENTMGCVVCEREALPPTCRDGLCAGAMACALEAAALWEFKSRNDACQVAEDCVTEYVGCEVTEDDCTGAVYYSSDFDRAEFALLRDEYRACTGGCSMCRRIPSAPACVSGHCVVRVLR